MDLKYTRRCDFFKKLLKAIVKILIIIAVIIIVIAAIVLSGGTALTALIPFGLSAGMFLAIGLAGLALAFMLDPETAKDTLDKAVTGIKGGISSVLDAGAEVVGGLGKSIVSNFLWLIPIGLIGWFAYDTYKSNEEKNNTTIVLDSNHKIKGEL